MSSRPNRINWRRLMLALFALWLGACGTVSPHWAADRREELRQAIVDGRHDEAQGLVSRYPDILPPAFALDLSVRYGDLAAIRHFLGLHPVNEPIDTDGATALMRAATDTPVALAPAVIRLLIDAGADPTRTDLSGRDATDYVRQRQEPTMLNAMREASPAAAAELPEPVVRTEWLPQLDWTARTASGSPAARTQAVGKRIVEIGAPWWLVADRWIPDGDALPTPEGGRRVDASQDDWIWASLRFHADGSGELMRYDARSGRTEPIAESHVAWDAYRDQVVFFVLAPGFASHCRSAEREALRVAIRCEDFAIPGERARRDLAGGLSQQAARFLLDNAGARMRLPSTGTTHAVLRAEAGGQCKARASRPRDRKRHTVYSRKPGSWQVYDRKLNVVFAPAMPQICSQSAARRLARDACRTSGGRQCIDLGGCPTGQASAVAGRQGHDWAWLACADTAARAREQALAQCRASSGCDCQLFAASDPVDARVCAPAPRR